MYLIFAFAFRPSKIGMFWGNYKIIETQLTYSVPLPPPPPRKSPGSVPRPSYNKLLPLDASLSIPFFHTNADLLTYIWLFVIFHLKIKQLAVPFYSQKICQISKFETIWLCSLQGMVLNSRHQLFKC